VSPVEEPVLECYYGLLPRHWGHGYATEAAAALLGYLFANTAVPEVRAYVSAENFRSAKVAARLGMRFLGRQAHPIFGRPGLLYVMPRELWVTWSSRDRWVGKHQWVL
jgi:RimJ/RimL family protein N-acetyltransferase